MDRILLSTLALTTCLLGPTLWLGAVTPTGAALSAALGGAICIQQRNGDAAAPRWLVAGVVCCLLVPILWTAAQLLPLPMSSLEWIHPEAATIWLQAHQTVGVPVSRVPLTIDPPSTLAALLAGVASLAWALAFLLVSGRSAGRVRLFHAVLASATATSVVGLIHAVGGLQRLYGLVRTSDATAVQGTGFLSPLLNPNHAAALACIAVPLAWALALEAKHAGATLGWTMLATVNAVAVVATLSRSGIAVLALEVTAMAALTAYRRFRASGAVAVGGAGGAGLVAALRLLPSDTLDLSKLRLPARALEFAWSHRWTGSGAGAFGPAFGRSQGGLPAVRFTHVENWPVQLVADFGVVVAVVVVVGGLIIAGRVARHLARPSEIAAFVALLGLLVHDLVDFAGSHAAIRVHCLALAAILVMRAADAAPKRTRRTVPRLAVVMGVGALGASVVGLAWRGRDLELELEHLPAATPTTLRAAMLRHPGEAAFPLALGIALFPTNEAGGALIQAVRTGPYRAATHFWLARWFLHHGRRSQAWGEYRAALRLSDTFAYSVLTDMVGKAASVDEILATAVTKEALDAAAILLDRAGRSADATTVDRQMAEQYRILSPRYRLVNRLRTRDLPGARRFAVELTDIAPADPATWLARASLETPPESERLLNQGLSTAGEDVALLEALVRLRVSVAGEAGSAHEIERLRAALSKAGTSPARVDVIMGEAALAAGDKPRALQLFLAAAGQFDDRQTLERVADLAEGLGRTSVASWALSRLTELHPEEASFVKRRALLVHPP